MVVNAMEANKEACTSNRNENTHNPKQRANFPHRLGPVEGNREWLVKTTRLCLSFFSGENLTCRMPSGQRKTKQKPSIANIQGSAYASGSRPSSKFKVFRESS